MGSGASAAGEMLGLGYFGERKQLRRNLILAVIGDPNNKDVLDKISLLKKYVVEHPHINATAAKEAAEEFDYSPTSVEAAFRELERLYALYETGRILKSVQCRLGPIACPVGHYMVCYMCNIVYIICIMRYIIL